MDKKEKRKEKQRMNKIITRQQTTVKYIVSKTEPQNVGQGGVLYIDPRQNRQSRDAPV